MYIHDAMDTNSFRKIGKEMVDYIADYLDNIHKRRVVPAIEPGYLRERLNEDPPIKPDNFQALLRDVDDHIMPGVANIFQFYRCRQQQTSSFYTVAFRRFSENQNLAFWNVCWCQNFVQFSK